ncbi:MAG: S8 family serine peptidase, partial [Acidimicrobiia bacterium]
KVAVIDSGIDTTHPDLQGVVLPGADFLAPGGDGSIDQYGHGTHVAGILAATVGNAIGVAGLSSGVRLYPVRVMDQAGNVAEGNLAAGIYWAIDHGANVINLSLGTDASSSIVAAAVQAAVDRGIVVVAAGGNDFGSGSPTFYPAALPGVIGVAATNESDGRASFSSVGGWVDLTAPGNTIVSTCAGALDPGSLPAGYCTLSGTSMSTAYTSALAAMLLQRFPAATRADVENILKASADDLGPAGPDTSFGSGILDPLGALGGSWFPDPPPISSGYRLEASDGGIFTFGNAGFFGPTSSIPLNQPIVGMATTPSGNGYWLVAGDGSVYRFGDAADYGSTAGVPLTRPIVGIARTPLGKGYWLVASDGGIFAFGDARFFGSSGAIKLNKPIVGMAATPSGNGYWLVATDGGIFAYGDALFRGSTGNIALNKPIVGMAPTPAGDGYWLVATDGGIFAFGASFFGSTGAMTLNKPIVGMASTGTGAGYWLVASDGGIFAFGDATFHGSTGGMALNQPIVAMAPVR